MSDPVLSWTNLGVSFRRRSRLGRSKPRPILTSLFGSLGRSEVLLVYGPRGTGKSTFLAALSFRLSRGFHLSDETVIRKSLPADTVHIITHEAQCPTSVTPLEALLFTDRLRNPSEPQTREARVRRILQRFRMEGHADVLLARGRLSDRTTMRIVAIAAALMGRPAVLAVDDPVSGLDPGSTSAMLEFLVNAARESGTALILVINHPGAELRLCDKVLLLSAHGRPAYFGPPSNIGPFIATAAGLPDQVPRAELMERLVHMVDPIHGRPSTVASVLESWQTSQESEMLHRDIIFDSERGRGHLIGPHKASPVAPFFTQVWCLVSRMAQVRRREPGFEGMRVVAYVGLALLEGLLLHFRFRKTGLHLFTASFFTVALTLLPANFLLFGAQDEFEIAREEIGNGQYSPTAFWLAQTIVDLVVLVLVSLVIGPILFYLGGFNVGAGRFGVFLATILLLVNASDSIIRFLIVLLPDPSLAFASSLVVYILSVLTMGFLIFRSQLIWVFRWMTWISLGYLSYSTILVNHLRGLPALDKPPFDLELPPLPGDAAIELVDLGGVNIAASLLTLFAEMLVLRLLTGVRLRTRLS